MSRETSEDQPTESPNALPKAYDPSLIEQRWADYWVRERIFDVPTPDPGETAAEHKKTFSLLLPPPNVTGRLHMGHMLNQTEIDILLRWHRMCGETALWVPGTDHAGIATQMMVERQLASEGTSRKGLGRDEFIARVWQWKRQYGSAITDQMRRLGASVDWSREYFTMDERLSPAVKEAFIRLYEQGLIYRGAYIVNWDPQIQTAVSDLEVESEERIGKLYSIRYPFADGTGSIVIATTRPETMLGDTAVAVNPNDDRYKHLIGTMLQLPLTQREIPIIADDWAKPEFGTGAVKVTPAHDPNDFAIGQRHNLPSPSVLDQTAHIDLPGSPFHGLDRFKARETIVAQLESIGLLVQVKDHPMTVPVSQRTGAVIEPRLSMQWFLAVSKPVAAGKPSIAQTAIDAVRQGHIKFTPEMYEKTYFEWMNNIHDWCISRQLWWGHRIPAWHCAGCAAITVARETPTACATCGSANITQETDVLDTWFSSGLLPFTVFGWPNPEPDTGAPGLTPDLATFYPTSLLITGFDILFFWVARMIMLGTHFMLDVPIQDGAGGLRTRTLAEAVPFREVYIHALVRDANREKMSKTKGNVLDPIDIIQRYGTDAVRYTLASQASPGTDIAFNEKRTEGYRAFANKIWNAARFLFMNLDRAREAGISPHLPNPVAQSMAPFAMGSGCIPSWPSSAPLSPLEDRWIFTLLSQTAASVNASLAEYRFDEAANTVYQFFWGDLCDWYLEIVKLRLVFDKASDKAAAVALMTLTLIFESALRLLSPFMPFLTEEIWHALYAGAPPAKSIALTRYPQASDYPADKAAVADIETLQQLIVTIRALRKEMGVPEKEAAPIRIFSAVNATTLAQAHSGMLAKLCRVGAVESSASQLTGANARSTPAFDVAVLYERQIDIPAERERLTKELAKHEKNLATCERQLTNEAFMAKAPAHIVDGLRKQAAEALTLRDKTKAALDSLKGAALPHEI
jgi:valyl-tRNA synthetase